MIKQLVLYLANASFIFIKGDCDTREYSYFDRNGNKINFSIAGFVGEFEESYYLLEKDSDKYIPNVSVNSNIAESRITNILKGIKSANDVNDFLAWKIGGIDHKASEESESVEYKKSWKAGKYVEERYFKCKRNTYNNFCERILDIQKNAGKKTTDVLLQEILDAVNETEVKGFGTVYILTILYFITSKESPIFDKYAYTAVKAIYNGVKPCEIWYENPSSKSKEAILKVIDEYKWYLKQVFGKTNICRKTDRALWVYGHPKAIEVRK